MTKRSSNRGPRFAYHVYEKGVLMLKLIAILLVLSPRTFAATIQKEFIGVNPHALPGDTEYNHLVQPGVLFHESNDHWGRTDKYMSGAGSIWAMYNWEHYSTSLSYKGRLLQPALEKRTDKDELATPIGPYAEWVETMWNQSFTLYSENSWALKLDTGLGYNDFGEHNLTKIYRSIHKAVGSPIKDEKFGEKLNDNFISTSAGAFIVAPISHTITLMAGYSVYNSKAFVENALETSAVLNFSRNWALSLKYMRVNQIRSEYYGNLRDARQQYMAGLRLFTFWTPSIMYTGPILKEDKYGQLYFSPVSFSWTF